MWVRGVDLWGYRFGEDLAAGGGLLVGEWPRVMVRLGRMDLRGSPKPRHALGGGLLHLPQVVNLLLGLVDDGLQILLIFRLEVLDLGLELEDLVWVGQCRPPPLLAPQLEPPQLLLQPL